MPRPQDPCPRPFPTTVAHPLSRSDPVDQVELKIHQAAEPISGVDEVDLVATLSPVDPAKASVAKPVVY